MHKLSVLYLRLVITYKLQALIMLLEFIVLYLDIFCAEMWAFPVGFSRCMLNVVDGLIDEAHLVFNKMSQRDVYDFPSNSIISGYAELGHIEDLRTLSSDGGRRGWSLIASRFLVS